MVAAGANKGFLPHGKNAHARRRGQSREMSKGQTMSRTYEKLTAQASKESVKETSNLPTPAEQHLPANDDDGWADAAAEITSRVLRGTLLKYADWKWTKGTEGTPIKDGTQLVALGTRAAWVKWQGGKPVQYVMRQPGKPLPERDELGDLDQGQWEAGPDGTPRNPWQNTRFVYLLDPITVEQFTFSTSSGGGRSAVTNLADQIKRMRELGHPDAMPIVELSAEPMKTKFGQKSKPVFKIVKWHGGGNGNDRGSKEIAPPSLKEEMADEIPF
jgi:hypothetical protein